MNSSVRASVALISVTVLWALARWAMVRSFQPEYSVEMATGEVGVI
jgi:hypothetical protein